MDKNETVLHRKTLLTSIVLAPLDLPEKLILARMSLSCPFSLSDKSDAMRVEMMLAQKFMFDQKKYAALDKDLRRCVILITRSQWYQWMSKNTFKDKFAGLCHKGYVEYDADLDLYGLTALAVADGKGGGVLNSIWTDQTLKLCASERWAILWLCYRKSFARTGFATIDDALEPIDVSISIWMQELNLNKAQSVKVIKKLTSKNLIIKHQDKLINSFSLSDIWFKQKNSEQKDSIRSKEKYKKAVDHWLQYKKEHLCTQEDDGDPIDRLCEKHDLNTITTVMTTLFTSKDITIRDPDTYNGINLEMDFNRVLRFLHEKKKRKNQFK